MALLSLGFRNQAFAHLHICTFAYLKLGNLKIITLYATSSNYLCLYIN